METTSLIESTVKTELERSSEMSSRTHNHDLISTVKQLGENDQDDQDEPSPEAKPNGIVASNNKIIACYSDKLNLKFIVNIQNQATMAHQRCFILTVHDLGKDSSQFDHFVHSEQMRGIRNRVVWLHVNLPGQELAATDLDMRKYPSLEELADELICVCDYLKIPQVVCMGDGMGANICAQFAIKHSNRCLGLVLIEPVASAASIIEIMRSKLLSRRHSNSNSSNALSSLSGNVHELLNRLGSKTSSSSNGLSAIAPAAAQVPTAVNEETMLIVKDPDEQSDEQTKPTNKNCNDNDNSNNNNNENSAESTASSSSLALPDTCSSNADKLIIDQETSIINTNTGRNTKNLSLLTQAFSSRSSLIEKVKELNIDILTAVGKESCSYNEAKRLYRTLQEVRRKDPKRLVNCPFLDIENSTHALQDKPDRLATSLQFFLQGIGLLSAMPMKSSGSTLYSRSISMEEADRPRSSSIQSDSLNSQLLVSSSNPSITDSSSN